MLLNDRSYRLLSQTVACHMFLGGLKMTEGVRGNVDALKYFRSKHMFMCKQHVEPTNFAEK